MKPEPKQIKCQADFYLTPPLGQNSCTAFQEAEFWVLLPGFRQYKISSLGRVEGPRGIRAERVDPSNGYKYIILWKEGKRINLNIHRLVCEAFHGPPPFPGAQALHRNGIKLDCSESNLYWGTPKQNTQDTIRAGNFASGENHYATNLNWDIVKNIRSRFLSGESQASIRKDYKLLGPRCSDICQNKTWKDPSYAPR